MGPARRHQGGRGALAGRPDGRARRSLEVGETPRSGCVAVPSRADPATRSHFVPVAVTSPSLFELGWDEGWARELSAAPDPSLRPGRISRIDRGVCTVLTEDGALRVAT